MVERSPIFTESNRPTQLALVGNPNTGKTTLFNALTGLRQRIGNYPGITVSMATGSVFLGKDSAYITDLPGTYSLAASSPDEKIVHDYINGNIPKTHKPDVLVCVVDATNINKNLYLVSQLAEHGIPMVIALSFWDSAIRLQAELDLKLLKKRLNIDVIPIDIVKNQGITELKTAILNAQQKQTKCTRIQWDPKVATVIDDFRKALLDQGVKTNSAEAHRLLFDSTLPTLIDVDPESSTLRGTIREYRTHIQKQGFHPHTIEAVMHHRHIGELLNGVIIKHHQPSARRGESIDRLLTHKFWGLIIFFLSMYLVFQSVYSWSAPFMGMIDWGKGILQSYCSIWLQNYPQLQSLVSDGVIEGVGAFLIFLPQILTLFFFISLLEETGYMSRAAFLMDRLFSWAGLSGKSFVPLLSSFACAIPGILATRTIEDRRARIITIFIAPLMSCSARLPVYVLVIGALIAPTYGEFVAGITLFAIHFIGILISIPTAYILNKVLKSTPSKPFIIEMPEYQIPKFRNLIWRMWSEGKEFIYRAGTIICLMTILIWALLYYPRPAGLESEVTQQFVNEQVASGTPRLEIENLIIENDPELTEALSKHVDAAFLNQSYMSRFGRGIQPVFAPAGFDWRISVGILASFPAREVIVSTLGVMFSLGGEVDEASSDMRSAMRQATWQEGPKKGQPLFTIPVAFAIMVFFALCAQCGSTLAVIRSEADTKLAIMSFLFMTTLAWIASVITYQGLELLL